MFLVRIISDRASLEKLQVLLEQDGYDDYVIWQLEDLPDGHISFYRDSEDEANSLKVSLERILSLDGGIAACEVIVEPVVPEDWENSWKEFFHAARLSEHIVVRPSWENWHGRPDDIEVIIDPGMSFGTGLHPTTRACIEFLDVLASGGGSFLDAGCGSGILSISAAKLGYSPVKGFDIDAVAVECTHENAAVNSISEKMSVLCSDVKNFSDGLQYDVVAVNILAPVIMGSAEVISGLVKPGGGHLLLAGLLTEQFGAVSSLFIGRGYKLLRTIEQDEWTSGMLQLCAM